MKDFLGREIHVGDTVIALLHGRGSSCLYKGRVRKLMNTMLEIGTAEYEQDNGRAYGTMKVACYKVVVIGGKGLIEVNKDQYEHLLCDRWLLEEIMSKSCNNCSVSSICQMKPAWGMPCRYNCAGWTSNIRQESGEDNDKDDKL